MSIKYYGSALRDRARSILSLDINQMITDLVQIKVTLPVDHYGDMVGYLSSIGGWLDDACVGERACISARVPDGAIPAIAR